MAAQPKLDQQWNHLPRHYCHRRRRHHHYRRRHRRRRRHHHYCHRHRRHQTMAQFEPLPTPPVSQISAKIFFVNM